MSEWRNTKILLWLLIVCVGAWSLVQFRPDTERPWPIGQTLEQKLLAGYERDNFDARLVFIALQGPPLRELAHASHELTTALRESGLFLLVANGTSEQAAVDRSFLWQHRFLLSPEVTAEYFEAGTIKTAIERSGKDSADPTDAFGSCLLYTSPSPRD